MPLTPIPDPPDVASVHVGTDGEHDYRLTVYTDGRRELTKRIDPWSTWSAPVVLEHVPAGAVTP